MSEGVGIAIVTGVVSLLTLLINLIVKHKLEKMHKQYNSRMDEFLAAVKKAGIAEGVLNEKERQGKNE